jgi:hypothetical protein
MEMLRPHRLWLVCRGIFGLCDAAFACFFSKISARIERPYFILDAMGDRVPQVIDNIAEIFANKGLDNWIAIGVHERQRFLYRNFIKVDI